MMETRYAIIENGVVTNVAIASGPWPFLEQTAVALTGAEGGVAAGWLYDGTAFTDPNPPPSVGIEPPTPPTGALRVTPLEFIDRFTYDEQIAIVSATMQNPAVKLWYDKLLAASFVSFDDPRLSAGLDVLVQAGLLTAERRAEIIPEVIQVSEP